MKTADITRALRNATSPQARLARWQSRPLSARLATLREHAAPGYPCRPCNSPPVMTRADWKRALMNDPAFTSGGPELSSLEADHPLLWVSENSPEVMDYFAGRDFLDHRGWYADQWQDETLETYAVRLARFPRLLFYAVKDSCNGDLRVSLEDWEEIDFSECESDYDTQSAIEDCAKEVIRSNDSITEREAEDSREYYEREDKARQIEENKETLAGLRGEIRALAHELKTLCPSPMATDFPAAASALRSSLKSLLADRRELMQANQEIAANL